MRRASVEMPRTSGSVLKKLIICGANANTRTENATQKPVVHARQLFMAARTRETFFAP